LIWDSEARIWYTTSDDIPGLILHADSFDGLVERVMIAAPEMLDDNLNYIGPIQITFEAERIEESVVV